MIQTSSMTGHVILETWKADPVVDASGLWREGQRGVEILHMKTLTRKYPQDYSRMHLGSKKRLWYARKIMR